MTGAQFEIRIDGTPRTYRDRKDYAMEAARFRIEQRGAVAFTGAGIAAVVILLITLWGYVF